MVESAKPSSVVKLGIFVAEEMWKEEKVRRRGWATVAALFLIFIWHFCRRWGFLFIAHCRIVSSTKPSLQPSSSAANPSSVQNSVPGIGGVSPQGLGSSNIISEDDLKNLMEDLDEKNSEGEKWENVIHKSNIHLTYNAKCSNSKEGPLRYLSTTLFENCTPEILRDFYMDNDFRKQWDKTLMEHDQLHVDVINGLEVGRTIKKFPFLTPREYVLVWRCWEGSNSTYYCFVKDCEHPLAPRQRKYVRVSIFRSGWRIRKVPGTNACEIRMIHQEDAGLNVEMAKLVFAKGIWSYVCKMENALRKYSLMVDHSQLSSALTAVTLIQKVPPELEAEAEPEPEPAEEVCSSIIGQAVSNLTISKGVKRRPSKRLITNGLILLGGLICLSHGQCDLGAKVAVAFIWKKLSKQCAFTIGKNN